MSERPEICTFEMVPASAKALLEKTGQRRLAEQLSQQNQILVSLCQIRSLVNLSRGPLLKNWEHLQAFALTKSFSLLNGGVRIFGIASSDKQQLQRFQKKSVTMNG